MDELIKELISDREKFNNFVYTPLDEAVREVEKRASDKKLSQYISGNLPIGRPSVLNGQGCAVLFRQLATPNYEIRRFVSLVDGVEGFTPVVFEYHSDKFVDKNEYKYCLGMLAFFAGRGKKGGEKISFLKIIDFNSYRGKKISEVMTVWGQSLVDFHHEMLDVAYANKDKKILLGDLSEWFSGNGRGASNYYKNFLMLFLQNDILFENFMLDAKELDFTKEIFLPAFIEIMNETGQKPLIVALEPTDVESDIFWMCHPEETKPFVDSKLSSVVKNPV